MMLADTMRSASIGAVVGFAVAFSIARALSAFLYGAKASDFGAYAIAGVMAMSVAALASFLGSRPLMKIDPAMVLRGD
jgi:ABC-type antimicrobial peptide transport system permease subunit